MHRNQMRDRDYHRQDDYGSGHGMSTRGHFGGSDYDDPRDDDGRSFERGGYRDYERERYQSQGMGQRGDRGYLAPQQRGYDRGGYDRGGYDRGGYDRGAYDRGAYGGSSYDRGGYDRGGYDRGMRGGVRDDDRYDRGTYGGYGRDYDQRGYGSQRMGGQDEGRFGGSRRDAYDHGEHPRYQRGGYGDEMIGRARRDDYGPTYRPGHESAFRDDEEDERYHGSSSRNYDQDWYGRASASPWNAWGRNRY
jgi:hypothetical protein